MGRLCVVSTCRARTHQDFFFFTPDSDVGRCQKRRGAYRTGDAIKMREPSGAKTAVLKGFKHTRQAW